MTETKFDVLGIGNAIVDVIARADDEFLATHGLLKGHMRLIEAQEALDLYAAMGPATEISGGSAANSCVGIASLGGRAAFIGKVANDQLGQIFAHDLRAAGVSFQTSPGNGPSPTARCMVLVTPDGERTMNTLLGISPEIDHGTIDPELVSAASIVYLEGYLFDRPEAKAAFHQAAQMARAAGRKVALSLSDGFCVDRHREDFLNLIRDRVEIVLANTDELLSLYQTDDFTAAVAQLRGDATLAAVTRSEKGSVIISQQGVVDVPAEKIDRLVDSTGAGDLYAAGFLFGLSRGMELAQCGRIASICAAEVIGHIGARPQVDLASLSARSGVEL